MSHSLEAQSTSKHKDSSGVFCTLPCWYLQVPSKLFKYLLRWAIRECERTGAVVNGESKRLVLGDTLYLIRYLTLSAAEFAAGPAQSGILLQQESFSILMNISCPGSWELPEYMAGMAEPRKDPGRLMEPPVLELRSKHWCKRAMMQVCRRKAQTTNFTS